MSESAFIEFLSRRIPLLPQDLKLLADVMDDGEFDEDLRVLAASAILYAIVPNDVAAGPKSILAYADDAVMVRVALGLVAARAPVRAAHYREKNAETMDALEADLATAHAFLGDDIFAYFGARLRALAREEYKGKHPYDFVRDERESGWLYEELQAALVDMEFDDDEVARASRKASTLLPRLRQKAVAFGAKKRRARGLRGATEHGAKRRAHGPPGCKRPRPRRHSPRRSAAASTRIQNAACSSSRHRIRRSIGYPATACASRFACATSSAITHARRTRSSSASR